MKKYAPNIQLAILTIFLVFLFPMLVFISQRYFIADSELWAITLSQHWLDFTHSSHFYKFLFFGILQFNHLWSQEALDIILGSRSIFGVLAGLQILTLAILGWRLFKDSVAVAILLLLFLSSTFFFSESIQVRSDNLIALLQMGGLVFLLSFQHNQKKLFLYLFFTFNLLIFLSSPKGLLHIFCNLILLQQLNLNLIKMSDLKKFVIKYKWLWGFAFLAFLFTFAQPLKMASYYFLAPFSSWNAFSETWSSESLSHLRLFLKENPLLWMLSSGAIFISIRSKQDNPFTYPALLAWALIVLHNDRLSFFIQSMLLFPVIHLAMFITRSLAEKSKFKILAVVAMAFLATANLAWHLPTRIEKSDNKEQLQALQEMEAFLKGYESPLYFDATGTLPNGHQVLNFPTPDHPQNLLDIQRMFRANDIEVVFWGNRLFNYFVPMNELLQKENFIQISPGLFVKAKLLDLALPESIETLKQVCQTNHESLQIYRGNNFLDTKWQGDLSKVCQELLMNPPQEIIALTRFKPFYFSSKEPFAHIFDSNPGL